MLALGSGCKYRLSLAERFDCTETIITQLLADSYQNPTSEWQLTLSVLEEDQLLEIANDGGLKSMFETTSNLHMF